MIGRHPAVVALAAITVLGCVVTAQAQPIDPYRAAVFSPDPPYFTDPRLPAEEVRTPDLSYPHLTREVARVIGRDPRFERVGPEELVAARGSDDLEARTRELADTLRDRGLEEFGRYELDSATTLLREALASYRDSDAYLTDPGDVATAHEYLARANVERAGASPEQSLELRNAARDHFREMIRLDPAGEIREGLFPGEVVRLYQETYLELLSDDGAALSLSAESARRLAARYRLDRVIWAFFIREGPAEGAESGPRVRLVLEVYAADGHRESREVVPIAPSTSESVDRVNRAVSRYLACVPLRREPPPPALVGDAGTVFLQAGWGLGIYAERPTRERFVNQGLGILLDYHLTDNFGLFGRANVWFSGRDSRGDLLDGFTSTRLSGGIVLSARAKWFRPFFGFGMELNVVGSYTASGEFWCKVSGGRPVFEAGRECLPEDLDSQDATVLFGPYLMPGLAFDIVGPFGAYILATFAFYITDANSSVDFPIGGEAGIEYRF